MTGFEFREQQPNDGRAPYDKMYDLFQQLLLITGGDVSEALSWMSELDRRYNFTEKGYGVGDFIEDLKNKGIIEQEEPGGSTFVPTAKAEREIRERSLEHIFGKLKKGTGGEHRAPRTGLGTERAPELRPYEYGDALDNIAFSETLHNAFVNHGIEEFALTDSDLAVHETEKNVRTATVMLIDISHSMILYGEDRITPAKKVALALAEMIRRKYPKDSLEVVTFGNDANVISIGDLMYLQVGPYHTNTVAALELAIDLLRRKKGMNKQIFMITDGKPTCIKENGRYYKNTFGLDRKIVTKTLNLSSQCRRMGIAITTFMVAKDPYLQRFVQDFTQANNGRAYYSGLDGLGGYVFEDYERNRRRKVR